MMTTTEHDRLKYPVPTDTFYAWLAHPFELPKQYLTQYLLCEPSGLPGKGHDAWGTMYAIILEYDTGEVTIESFARKYKHIQWYIYTTSSHTEEHHRFRVVLWLKDPVEYETIKQHKEVIYDYFPGCDRSSLSNWQKAPNRTEHFRRLDNPLSINVELYSMDMVLAHATQIQWIPRPKALKCSEPRDALGRVKTIRKPDQYREALAKEILGELDQIPRHPTGGKRYQHFFRVISKMASAKINGELAWPKDVIANTILQHTNDDKRHKMLASILGQREDDHNAS